MLSALYCKKGRGGKKAWSRWKGYTFRAENRREFNLHPLGISKEVEKLWETREMGHMGIFKLFAKEIYLSSSKVRWNIKKIIIKMWKRILLACSVLTCLFFMGCF